MDLARAINRPWVNCLYCAPHSFDHKRTSGLRHILNPPGTTARIHQRLDIGQGEADWDVFCSTPRTLGFDGVATACVFAREERARESSTFMPDRITKELIGRNSASAPRSCMTGRRPRPWGWRCGRWLVAIDS